MPGLTMGLKEAGGIVTAALLALTMARAEELKPALTAQPEFLALDGAPVAAIAPGKPFLLRVTVATPFSDKPPAGLQLMGWLRRVDPENLPCQQAAEAFLRSGRLPMGAVFLNDPVIGVATADHSFLVSDPDFSLAQANILAAHSFENLPGALAVDDAARRFLLTLPAEDRVVGIDAGGSLVLDLAGLAAPKAVAAAPDGKVAVLDGTGRLLAVAADGAVSVVAQGVADMRPAFDPRWMVAVGTDWATLHDMRDGSTARRLAAVGLLDAAALAAPDAPPFAIAALNGQTVDLHYLDSAEDAPVQSITLPIPATRLAASRDGRVLLAWSPDGGPLHVIDVARGRLVRSVGAAAPIAEVAFSDRSAFLMLQSQTHVGALDLLAIARGSDAEFREIPIGNAALSMMPGHQLLAPLQPLDGVLAVHAETFQGYRIMDGSVMGDAPAMTATPLRGGVPFLVAALDRSFRSRDGGPFETVATLPGPGRFELVATTGLGALSFCSELPVAEPDAGPAAVSGLVELVQDGHAVRLKLLTPDGAPGAGLAGKVVFSALVGSWRRSADLTTDASGQSTTAFVLPDSPGLLIQVDMPGSYRFKPLLIEGSP